LSTLSTILRSPQACDCWSFWDEKYNWQKKNYENSNISSFKNIIFKKSSNQNPSRYIITL
jgi:hypothetical protein